MSSCKLDASLFQQRVLAQPGGCVVMCWVEPILFHADFSEDFKHVCQQHGISFYLQVVVVYPDLLCMVVLFIGYAFFWPVLRKLFFLWQLCLGDPFMTTSRRFKCVPQILGLLSIHIFNPLFLLIPHSFRCIY